MNERERKLSVYEDDAGANWVVAYLHGDAMAVWLEHTGERAEDYPDMTWELRDDDDEMTILVEAPVGKAHERKTMREWALENGRGLLCSTEY